MHPGEFWTALLACAAFIGTALIAYLILWFAFVRPIERMTARAERPKLAPLSIYGDWPHVAEEARGGKAEGGGLGAKAARAQGRTSEIAPHGKRPTP